MSTISPTATPETPDNHDYDDTTNPYSSFEAIAPRIAGSITVISSLTIIFIIFKSPQRFTTTYHRIMAGLSFYCILAGFSIGFSTLFLPSSENYNILYKWPQNWTILGNVRSCEFQAFGQSCGIGCAVGYIMSLCIYYVCCLTFRMSKDTIVKRVEWLFHLIPHLIGWTFSIWQLYEKMMNPHIDLPLCFNEVYPPSCKATDLQECERGSNRVAKATSDIGVAFLFCAVGVIFLSLSAVCTTLITRSCRPNERSDHNLAAEEEYTQVCKIGVMHCLLYLASSVISILPLVFNSDRYSHILDNWTRKVLVLLVSPLIGFYNLLVFIWGKIYGYKLLYPSVGLLEALKKLFSSEALGDESLFLSNINIVDQEVQAEEEEVDIDINDYDMMLRAEVQSSMDEGKSAKKADTGLDVPVAGPLSLGKQKDELDADAISLISSSLKTPAYNQVPATKDSEEEDGFFYSTPIIEKSDFYSK